MICFSRDGIEVNYNGEIETSHGPYGWLCLGLVYVWDDKPENTKLVCLCEI